ncbi:dihydropteroate synthase [Kwoniella dejecticola CBS 10117]|uniref:Dihydropteroate synthase n=1 Tax=Kwoniella dejecticola CBS 10117 TaxID=1296121 RepID=A0A1A6AGJ5_9TREE|nr:dihydropteroate synthase [Kwoniella dejecticola CBS 10117]OBR89148.1 dihydropteroate synthase [Kwoniella dejecticola CBS 10117]
MPPRDSVNLESLSIHLPNGLGPSAFNLSPPPACPITLNISMRLIASSIRDTAEGDSMSGLGVNYSVVCKQIYALAACPGRNWSGPWELMWELSRIPLSLPDVEDVTVEVVMPKALLHADSAVYRAVYTKQTDAGSSMNAAKAGVETQSKGPDSEENNTTRRCEIRDLKTECIIGLHPHERSEKQRLELDISVEGVDWKEWKHKEFADAVYDFVTMSAYGTIESLIHALGSHLFELPILRNSHNNSRNKNTYYQPSISITIRKPSAIPYAVPSITIQRTAADYPSGSASASASAPASAPDLRYSEGRKRVFIAVGSNIGDRVANIHRAIKELESSGCEIVGTSRLYESEPMYVEDQDRFINGAIELYTSLEPLELLRLLKRTEKSVGRKKTFTNGPRVIDLDLIFYGDEQIMIGERGDKPDEDGVGWLECPHRSLGEREFVLRPLADIAPNLVHPSLRQTNHQLLSRLPSTSPPPLQPIIPFSGPSKPLRLSSPAIPYVMAIFNATPDSFSDGDSSRTDPEQAIKAVEKLFADENRSPDILDIGGMSTRPNSDPCTEEEEVNRVIPLIQAIRSSPNPRLRTVAISIDTYRASVARLAVQAGANCINDVRGGSEPGMLEVMAETNVPVVLMHSKGDSKTMTSAQMTDYSSYEGGVVEGVRTELREMVDRALKKGVKRWNIILDPGLGFAKTQQDNVVLLKSIRELIEGADSPLKGYPMLVGGSRKGFVGKIISRQIASERSFGDAALNSYAVHTGVVDVLRVHQVGEAKDAINMSVAIRDA